MTTRAHTFRRTFKEDYVITRKILISACTSQPSRQAGSRSRELSHITHHIILTIIPNYIRPIWQPKNTKRNLNFYRVRVLQNGLRWNWNMGSRANGGSPSVGRPSTSKSSEVNAFLRAVALITSIVRAARNCIDAVNRSTELILSIFPFPDRQMFFLCTSLAFSC